MKACEIIAAIRDEVSLQKTNPFRLAIDHALPENAVRYTLEGRDSRLSRIVEICDSLGLVLTVQRASELESEPTSVQSGLLLSEYGKSFIPHPDEGLAPVSDKRLAKILAWFHNEWSAGDEFDRGRISERFDRAFPEFVEGGADIRRVVAMLGWHVIENSAATRRQKK